ncbi:basic proline-rich protein-like [Cavia porcellus]|uniref:basic proline-rich protein-like n=1 Tax=Cavia porcellus TaxID=10141 RepID=UPI002FDFB1AD
MLGSLHSDSAAVLGLKAGFPSAGNLARASDPQVLSALKSAPDFAGFRNPVRQPRASSWDRGLANVRRTSSQLQSGCSGTSRAQPSLSGRLPGPQRRSILRPDPGRRPQGATRRPGSRGDPPHAPHPARSRPPGEAGGVLGTAGGGEEATRSPAGSPARSPGGSRLAQPWRRRVGASTALPGSPRRPLVCAQPRYPPRAAGRPGASPTPTPEVSPEPTGGTRLPSRSWERPEPSAHDTRGRDDRGGDALAEAPEVKRKETARVFGRDPRVPRSPPPTRDRGRRQGRAGAQGLPGGAWRARVPGAPVWGPRGVGASGTSRPPAASSQPPAHSLTWRGARVVGSPLLSPRAGPLRIRSSQPARPDPIRADPLAPPRRPRPGPAPRARGAAFKAPARARPYPGGPDAPR